MTILRKTILSLVLILSFTLSYGQSNPEFTYEQVLIGTNSSTTTIYSEFPGVQYVDHFTIGNEGEPVSGWQFNDIGGGDYEFTLNAGDISEDITFIYKYFISSSNSNIPKARYIYLNYSVVPSILTATRDYVLTDESSELVPVTNNDISSSNSFDLETIVKEQDLIADVSGLDLEVSPLSSENKMYAQYVIQDSVDTYSVGTLVAVPENAPNQDITLNHFTTNKATIEFTLPSSDYTLDDTFGNPDAITAINPYAMQFKSDDSYIGLDSVRFNHSNGTYCTVYFQVYNKTANNGFLRDDVVYVARNQTVLFSVLTNDLEDNLSIVASSADDHDNLNLINASGEGLFSFTPDENYVGVQNFTYSCIYLNELQTANIKIIVSDQEPETSNNAYDFVTMANTPYVFEYPVSISTSSLSVGEQAENGTVYILDNDDELVGDCYSISGENKIVYIPNEGFSGFDNFKINYSPGGNLQYALNTDIEVISEEDEDCYCTTDCVYQGDVDNDGKVDLLDLFAFGKYFGSLVEPRNNDSNSWIGQSSEESSLAKYADIDGNGIVNEDDLNNFFEYHGQSHSFYQTSELISSEYTIIFDPQVETIDSGELLRIDVLLGDNEFPAIEVDGVSFALNAGGAFADSASMDVVYEANSWFCHNDPTLALTHVPYDGRIETSVVNTANTSGSGQGIVAVVEFIVEEDVDDIRLGEDQSKVLAVTIEDIFISGKGGQIFKLAPQTIEIPWASHSENLEEHIQDLDDLILYPNPASHIAKIYLNGPETIQKVQLMSLSGQLIQSYDDINTDDHALSLNGIPNGIYIVHVQGEKYNYTKKLSIVR